MGSEMKQVEEQGFLMSQVANTSYSLAIYARVCVYVSTCVMTRIWYAFMPAYSYEINRLLLKFVSGRHANVFSVASLHLLL